MGYERIATARRDQEQIPAAKVRRDESVARRPARTPLTLPDVGSAAGVLQVGAVDDLAERDADRVADQVLRRLESGDGALFPDAGRGRVQRSSAVPTSERHTSGGRVRRAAAPTVGLEGGALDAADSAAIQRARRGGSPLDDGVRRRMESGFGSDLGSVRLHTGAEATRLNESMQAQAFAIGSDVFLHDNAPRPGSPGGDHLLAHEIAHTMQQSSGASRSAVHRRMMNSATFMQSTKEGLLTGTSTAQKAISKMLDAYNKKYPYEKYMQLKAGEIDAAVNDLAQMRDLAQGWISKHTVSDLGGESLGQDIVDKSRMKRRGGMEGFIESIKTEMLTLLDLKQVNEKGSLSGPGHDLSQVTVTEPSEDFSKVKAHYDGDMTSMLRKVGFLIDAAVPLAGDKCEIEAELKIPVQPPGYVGAELGVSAERDETHVEVEMSLGVTGGASVDVASIGGALGGYIKAKAKTGADCAELVSYGLFRRSRQSNLIPREIENWIWGGGKTGEFGWAQAEKWSLGVENRIFGDDDEASVETGAYLSAKMEAELGDLGGLEVGAKGTLGTEITKESLEKRKGGAGKRNLRSGAAPDSGNYDQAKSRGAQKSVGVGVGGLELSVGGSFGPFSAALEAAFGWKSDGAHGKKTVTFDSASVGGELAFTMPMGQVIGGGIGNLIPKVVEVLNRVIRSSIASAEKKDGLPPGAALGETANYTSIVAELATIGKEAWDPFKVPDPDTAGFSAEGEQKFSFGVEFDLAKSELTLTLNQSKSLGLAQKALNESGKVSDIFSFSLERTSRLLQVTYAGGKWTVS